MNPKLAAITKAMTVDGMLDGRQIGYLYELAKAAPDGAACEAGIWRGRSFIGWAYGRYDQQAKRWRGPLYAVDWWRGSGDTFGARERRDSPDMTPAEIGAGHKAYFLAALDRLGLTDAVSVYDCKSWDAPGKFGQPLAFAFIDACHQEYGIRKDIATYPRHVMPGGILAFHDYATAKNPAIAIVVDEWHASAQWERLGYVGSVIAFRRPG